MQTKDAQTSVPAISIVTPVWNNLPYLKETVASVLTQDFCHWEWIIADDCSTDGSREYLDTINDPRIKIFKNSRNLGIFGNLNYLFSLTTAPAALILCADDYLMEGGLAVAIDEWNSSPPEVAFVRFNWLVKPNVKSLGRFSFSTVPGTVYPTNSDLLFFIFGNIPGNLSNNIVRVASVQSSGGWRADLPYAGDFELWSRLGHNFPFRVVGKQISYIRRHPGAASYHLNRRGELVAQMNYVVGRLYGWLINSGYPKWLLRLYSTANYEARQRDCGIKALLTRGSYEYLRVVEIETANVEHFLPKYLRWITYISAGGGRFGLVTLAKILFKFTPRPLA